MRNNTKIINKIQESIRVAYTKKSENKQFDIEHFKKFLICLKRNIHTIDNKKTKISYFQKSKNVNEWTYSENIGIVFELNKNKIQLDFIPQKTKLIYATITLFHDSYPIIETFNLWLYANQIETLLARLVIELWGL